MSYNGSFNRFLWFLDILWFVEVRLLQLLILSSRLQHFVLWDVKFFVADELHCLVMLPPVYANLAVFFLGGRLICHWLCGCSIFFWFEVGNLSLNAWLVPLGGLAEYHYQEIRNRADETIRREWSPLLLHPLPPAAAAPASPTLPSSPLLFHCSFSWQTLNPSPPHRQDVNWYIYIYIIIIYIMWNVYLSLGVPIQRLNSSFLFRG